MTEISVEVVSSPVIWFFNNFNDKIILPQKADQSLTTTPAPIKSLPLFTVPAHSGIYRRFANSSNSSTEVRGWTKPP